MPAQDNTLQSKYLTRPVVRQRNSVTLVGWSAYVSALAIPAAPDDDWIRQRIAAENLPLSLDFATTQTLVYFLQDSNTQTNILQFISEDNDATTESSLASQNDTIIAAFAPRWARATVTDAQVQAWKDANGVTKK